MDMGVMLAAMAETAILVAYFSPRESKRKKPARRYTNGRLARR